METRLSVYRVFYSGKVELITSITRQGAIEQSIVKFGSWPERVEYVGIA